MGSFNLHGCCNSILRIVKKCLCKSFVKLSFAQKNPLKIGWNGGATDVKYIRINKKSNNICPKCLVCFTIL